MNRLKSPLALLSIVTLCFSGCVTAPSDPPAVIHACPAWPVAGPLVADELSTLPADRFPALWEWLGRLAKHRDQLEVVRRG